MLYSGTDIHLIRRVFFVIRCSPLRAFGGTLSLLFPVSVNNYPAFLIAVQGGALLKETSADLAPRFRIPLRKLRRHALRRPRLRNTRYFTGTKTGGSQSPNSAETQKRLCLIRLFPARLRSSLEAFGNALRRPCGILGFTSGSQGGFWNMSPERYVLRDGEQYRITQRANT